MKAKIKPSYDNERKRLADIIPLNAPFTIFIEPTRYCNFKCFYCLHSTKNNQGREFDKTDYEIKHMDFSTYEKLLGQIKKLPESPKRIVFSGLGEPLMNTELPKMIALAKDMKIAERLDILTNASLLTSDVSDELIAAGATRIQVSLQGLDSAKYSEVSNVKIDLDKLYENLAYLYKNKGNCSIFIKIIDSLLEGEADKERFYGAWGKVSDQIFIEHLITLQQQMGDHGGKADNSKNLNNEEVIYRNVCPVIFYMLQIDADGNVFPCPVSGLPKEFSIGNINEEDINQIWNGTRRKNLIKSQLMHNRKRIPICATCMACSCVLHENEYLDDISGRLLSYFND